MQFTQLGHSAVLIEVAGKRLLIDPGAFSTDWHRLTELDAVLVTHQHPDHCDPDHIGALLQANPQARVLVEPSVLEVVELPGGEVLEVDASVNLDEVTITAVGGAHAIIHRDIPRIGNVGLVIQAPAEPTFFHPGDSLATVPAGIDVLAVPAMGPWAAMKETVDFVRDVAAPHGFMIHYGLLNERGWELLFRQIGNLTDTELSDHRDGEPWQVSV